MHRLMSGRERERMFISDIDDLEHIVCDCREGHPSCVIDLEILVPPKCFYLLKYNT